MTRKSIEEGIDHFIEEGFDCIKRHKAPVTERGVASSETKEFEK